MTERQLIEAAKARITDPSRHCTGTLARDRNGDDVDPRSRDAVSWCAYGALLAVAPVELLKLTQPIEPGDEVGLDAILIGAAEDAYRTLCEVAAEHYDGADTLADVNDHFSHADVLGLFDKPRAAY